MENTIKQSIFETIAQMKEELIKLFFVNAQSLPEVKLEPHFEKTSFKVSGKIFATLNLAESRGTVKLSEENQDLFCLHDKEAVFPVPNKWGKHGWTHLNFNKVKQEIIPDILVAAYLETAPDKLKEQVISILDS